LQTEYNIDDINAQNTPYRNSRAESANGLGGFWENSEIWESRAMDVCDKMHQKIKREFGREILRINYNKSLGVGKVFFLRVLKLSF
jgi:hypothetical protein